MCSNYRPVTQADRLLKFFGVVRDGDTVPADAWPLGMAPFLRLAEDGSGNVVCEDGIFGLLPHFRVEMAAGRKTYNARTETVATLPSFRQSWKNGWRCIIPCEWIYEPNWETGRAVRWRIQLPNGEPMGVAGIYRTWTSPEGERRHTFAMLTVNADGHAIMQRFHKPGDEKRMVVILRPEQYGEWLSCSVAEAPKFFSRWGGALDVMADPLPARPPKAISGKVINPAKPAPPETGSLF